MKINDVISFFNHKSKAGIVFISLIEAFTLTTFSVLSNSYLSFQIAKSINDLSYIEHALELKHQMYFEQFVKNIRVEIN